MSQNNDYEYTCYSSTNALDLHTGDIQYES
jgi:hypothetical protein